MKAIEFKGVWEKYRIKYIDEGRVWWEELWALEDINFSLDKGKVLGIIGKNGAGKTTLLKLIAGMLVPDRGEIKVEGKVSTLMELGAGFNPEFTGKENILINAQLYGLKEEELEMRLKEIIEFAGLGKFIHAPLKYYSQGMFMRLAFSLAIFVEPDILLIDDILAVGDREAQEKCIKKVFELKDKGKTIVLVSHDMGMIEKLCDEVILLDKGKVVFQGLPQEVIPRYLEISGDEKGIGILEKESLRIVFNNGRIFINYNKIPLTKDIGGYLSFFLPKLGNWSSSLNLNWQIKKQWVNGFIAEGSSFDGNVVQTWEMSVEKDKFDWKIKINEDSIKEAHIDLLLTPEYKGWLSLEKKGEFGPFLHKSNWQELSLDNYKGNIIGIRTDGGRRDFPNLLFEVDNAQFKLFNTGYNQESRVIQLCLGGDYISVRANIFPDIDAFEEYFRIQKEELLAQRSINSGALRLFCDLENKSIRLYYRDKEITKWTGLYSSFVYNHQWYDTGKAEWEVEKKDRDLIIRLKWMGEDIRQEWRLYYEESKLVWEIKHATEINLGILKFGLILNPEYQRYFCGYEEGKFPLDFTVWQNMPLLNPWASRFGVRKEMNLPAIIIERPEETSIFFQNGDKTSLCRDLGIAVSKTFLEKKIFDLKTSFGFLEEEKAIEEYLSQERSKINLLDKKEDLLSISLNYFSIYVDIESKSIRLYYKGKEITRGKGLSTTFCVKNHPPFNLSHSRWQTKKISSKELLLIVQYEPLAVIQTWTLSIDENQGFKFKIEMDVAEFFYLIYWDIIIELSGDYVSWKTAYEEKNFSGNWISNDICPIRMREKRISKLVLEQNLDKNLPLLSFDFYSDSGKRILSMFKRKEKNEEIIVINSSIVYPLEEQKISPGEHKYGEGRILIGKEISLEEKTSIEDLIELKNKYLRVTFTHGKGDIFWKEKNLTSGLGIFTSLRLERIWYDSYQAAWQIKEKDRNRIIAIGTWGHIPLVQIWELKIMEDNLIYWRVDSEIYEELNLEIEQTNLMLSSEYKNWIVPNFMQGNFPDEYTQDYDILPFRFWYGETRQIIADAENLPQVIFKNNLEDRTFRAIVENTDYLYRARLLQYQKANIYSIKPGKYLYFEGEIEIVAKK